MKLLNIYENREQAEDALDKIIGEKRLASERDGTDTIYNLFGEPTWRNFYNLNMFNLKELEEILSPENKCREENKKRHREIISMLRHVEKSFEIKVPQHWLLFS